MNATPTLTIVSLTRSDQADLLDHFPAEVVKFDENRLAPGHLGEPVSSIILIALTVQSITCLCAWIASTGKNVNLACELEVPGVKSKFQISITETSTAQEIRNEVEAKGGKLLDTENELAAANPINQ